jgi:hypothetical protein
VTFAYANNGRSLRAVDAKYRAAEGEVLFPGYATPEQLAATFPDYAASAPRRMLRKSTITARLIEANKIGAAMAALNSNPAFFGRWIAADHPTIFADDPDALALLGAIGADIDTIMAPEADLGD